MTHVGAGGERGHGRSPWRVKGGVSLAAPPPAHNAGPATARHDAAPAGARHGRPELAPSRHGPPEAHPGPGVRRAYRPGQGRAPGERARDRLHLRRRPRHGHGLQARLAPGRQPEPGLRYAGGRADHRRPARRRRPPHLVRRGPAARATAGWRALPADWRPKTSTRWSAGRCPTPARRSEPDHASAGATGPVRLPLWRFGHNGTERHGNSDRDGPRRGARGRRGVRRRCRDRHPGRPDRPGRGGVPAAAADRRLPLRARWRRSSSTRR